MMTPIKTHLPQLKAPLEWATRGADTVHTTLIAMRADGTIETGDIRKQTNLILENLRLVMEAAGGSMRDVTIVQVFMTEPADYAAMNEEYAKHFTAPAPTVRRSTSRASPSPASGSRSSRRRISRRSAEQ
jgi:enamine deaminase RidA (YjgF/YER057c/UK114 family)